MFMTAAPKDEVHWNDDSILLRLCPGRMEIQLKAGRSLRHIPTAARESLLLLRQVLLHSALHSLSTDLTVRGLVTDLHLAQRS